jgi:hypothetical protein
MTRSFITTAAVAAAFVSSSAFAESPSIDSTIFASGKTRAAVQAELKSPYAAGNPWSSQYNMFGPRSAITSEQVRSTYKMSRGEVNALNAEDSGSAYFTSLPLQMKASATMGGPPMDPSNLERDR